MKQRIGKYVLNLEKKFEIQKIEAKNKNKLLPCLYCGDNPVWDFENSNLCEFCRKDFGHNYLREL